MPWLPLAILLIAALTVAALALILFPPGEPDAADPQDDEVYADDEALAAEEEATDDPEPTDDDEPDQQQRTDASLRSE